MIVTRNTPGGVRNFVEHNYPYAKAFFEFDRETGDVYLFQGRNFISTQEIKAGDPVRIVDTYKVANDRTAPKPFKIVCCEDTPGEGYNCPVEFRWYL